MSYSIWARHRKTLYTLGAFLIFLSILIPTVLILTHKPPTCFDGKKNQGETGVDVGGPCRRLDPRFLEPMRYLWTRPLKVRDGIYNVITYVQNNNTSAAAKDVPYAIALYDDKGVLLARKTGKTDIYPSMIMPIFDGAIDVGARSATAAEFTWLSNPVWIRYKGTPMQGLKITNQQISTTHYSTRLYAKVQNTTIEDKANIYFVATLFDKNGSAIAVSRTYEAYIKAGHTKDIAFTWQGTFDPKPASVDIIPLMPIE